MTFISGGVVRAAEVWAFGVRNLTFPNHETAILPVRAAPIAVTAGVNGNFGNWFEITAATVGATMPLYLAHDNDVDLMNESFVLQLGTGAALAEVVIANIPSSTFNADQMSITPIPPRVIPDGTRVAVRGAITGVGIAIVGVYLVYAADCGEITQI